MANWVAKTANLLVAQGSPERVGLLLPLHWSAVTLLLGAVASGATAVLAAGPDDLAHCGVAFTTAQHAEAALDAGVDEVYAVSTAPLGGRLRAPLPSLVLDAGVELPVHGDTYGGRLPSSWSVERAGAPLRDLPDVALGPYDRVLTVLDPAAADGLVLGLLAPLHAGAALVLCPGGAPQASAAAAEQVTATVGIELAGLRRLG